MDVSCLNRRRFLRGGVALAGMALLGGCVPLPAGTPPSVRVPRVGWLLPDPTGVTSVPVLAFRQALGDLGYVEGTSVAYEYRAAPHAQVDELPQAASASTPSSPSAPRPSAPPWRPPPPSPWS